MSKKRKEAATQSSTLHDFFGKGRSPANKKPKTLSQNHTKKPPVKRERFTVAPEDIIVIDSDNENEVIVKAEPVDDASSDVEILDQPPPQKRSLSRLTNSHSDNVSPTKATPSFGNAELLNPSPPEDDTNESFGTPYLLLDEASGADTPILPNDTNGVPKEDLRIPKAG